VAARLAKMIQTVALKRRGARTDLVADLLPGQRRRSTTDAAARINVSSRLAIHACNVLKHGVPELIAEVDSGDLAVSAASILARLPNEEQLQAVSGGLRALAAKVRELRGPQSRQRADRPALGCFGVLEKHECETPQVAGTGPVALLWIPAGRLSDAIHALQARGFHYTPLAA